MNVDQRIASALTDEITSADLELLISEAKEAITTAEEAAEAARKKALDPALSPDPTKARVEMDEAAFARDRLRTAFPRLQERHREVYAAERYAEWLPKYEAMKAKQTTLAQELEEIYPAFEQKIVDLLLRIEKVDGEAINLDWYKPKDSNGDPWGDGRHLGKTEQLVRPNVRASILQELKLPSWSGETQLAWPPFRPLIVAVPPMPCPPLTPEQIAARSAARVEESESVIAHYAAMQRERQEREAKEAREDLERQIAERNRRHGWG
jgi:hypothetical protein